MERRVEELKRTINHIGARAILEIIGGAILLAAGTWVSGLLFTDAVPASGFGENVADAVSAIASLSAFLGAMAVLAGIATLLSSTRARTQLDGIEGHLGQRTEG